MKRCALLFLFCLGRLIVPAQDCPVDSVFSAYNTSVFASANDKGVCYIELGLELGTKVSLECGIETLDRGLPLLSDSVLILRAICNKGLALTSLGRHSEAEKVLTSILPFCERARPFTEATFTNWIIDGVYDGLASSCTFTGNYSLAIRSAYTSLELGLLFPQKANMRRKYVDLGLLYYKIRDNVTAATMYKRAMAFEKGSDADRADILSDLAHCYSEMDSLEQANVYLDSAEVVCAGNCSSATTLFFNFARGMVALKKEEFQKAAVFFRRSLSLSIERGNSRMIADNFAYLARVYLKTGDYDSAEYVLKKGELVARDEGLNEILLDIYRQSISLFLETERYHRLVHYQEKFTDQKERMYNAELARDLAIVEGQMTEKDHLEKLRIQQSEIATREALLESQKWAQRLGIMVALLVLFLTVLQFQVIAQRRKIKEALSIRIKERASRLNVNKKAIALWSDKFKAVNVLVSHELDVIYLFLNATSRGNDHGSKHRLIDLALRKFHLAAKVTSFQKVERYIDPDDQEDLAKIRV